MSHTWAHFARTGKVEGEGLRIWPAYSSASRCVMIFDDECRVLDDPWREERLAIASLKARRRPSR